jgi:chemotaxis family two-component system response regulator Rcp1
MEILLIEDNPGDVRLLEEAFRELRADVRLQIAKDGAEGIHLIEDAQGQQANQGRNATKMPDLILLDLNLPKVNGHDVLARIKSNPGTRRIPVIVLTSSRAASDVHLAYDSHANAYLKKPTNLDELIRAVGQIKSFWMDLVTLPEQ